MAEDRKKAYSPIIALQLISGMFDFEEKRLSGTRLVNWYVEGTPTSSQYRLALIPTPGLKSSDMDVGTLATEGSCRALFEYKGKLYRVAGNKLRMYKRTATSGWEACTGLSELVSYTVGSRLSVAQTHDAVMIADGEAGYYINGTGLADNGTITSADAPARPKIVTSLANYFICTSADSDSSNKFFVSAINDPTTWDALDFATAENMPDRVTAVKAHQGLLMVFGEYSTELWYPSGNVDFPFEPLVGKVSEYGTTAPHTIATSGNSLFYVGRSRTSGPMVMWQTSPQEVPRIISNAPINKLLEETSGLANAWAFCYTSNGHDFYVLQLPDQGRTFVYDLSTEIWHERDYFKSSGKFTNSPINAYCFFNNKHLVGVSSDETVRELDSKTYTDLGGRPIRRLLKTALFESDAQRLFVNDLHVECEPGIGLQNGQGSDPQLMLRYSTDFGNTWIDADPRSVGKIGEGDARALWTRLGSGRSFRLELTATDPVNWVIVGAVVHAKRGRS